MSKYKRPLENQLDRKCSSKVKPTCFEQADELANFRQLPNDSFLTMNSSSTMKHTTQLGNPRFQTAQQHAMAKQMGRTQGNSHLYRMIASLKGDTRLGAAPSEQAGLTLSHPRDAAEQEAHRVASQVMVGEPVQITQPAAADVHGNWLSDAWGRVTNAVGDALDTRDNEAALDEWEDYQDAMQEQRKFSSATHTAENFQSTTRLGMFDAIYNPGTGTLQIVCKCKFSFTSGNPTEFPTATPEQLTWTDQAEMDSWKARFISTVSSAWSAGNHIFYCQKDWWELMSARVQVEIREVDADEHFALEIAKIPTGGFRRSGVYKPDTGLFGGLFGYTPGRGEFDSEDLNMVNKPGGQQIPAVHEAGHMLGLDDEYETGETDAPSHSDLVESEFGHGVARGADGRIMSGGSDIQPEHGVTFLAALKEATGMDEWLTSPKEPRSIPNNPASPPVGPGDFPTPSSDTVPV